jgi:glutamine amidotransferase
MSDGEHLIAYGHDRLHYLERHNSGRLNGNSVLIATEPLDEYEEWITFQPGELRLYHSGKMIGRMMTQTMPVDSEPH